MTPEDIVEVSLVKGKIDHDMIGKDCFFLVDDIKQDKSVNKIQYGEQLHAELTPINNDQLRRSLRQLGLYWACCKLVAENYPDSSTDYQSWNTKEKVSEQCKIQNKHIEYYFYYRNPKTGTEQMNIKTKSIAFKNMNHNEAIIYFSDALTTLAVKLNISVNDLIDEAKKTMNSNLY